MTVSNKSIEDKLDRVFTEKFGCSADKVEMMREHRFLSSEIGFSATVNARFYVYPPKKKSDILYLVTDNPRTIVYNYFYTS